MWPVTTVLLWCCKLVLMAWHWRVTPQHKRHCNSRCEVAHSSPRLVVRLFAPVTLQSLKALIVLSSDVAQGSSFSGGRGGACDARFCDFTATACYVIQAAFLDDILPYIGKWRLKQTTCMYMFMYMYIHFVTTSCTLISNGFTLKIMPVSRPVCVPTSNEVCRFYAQQACCIRYFVEHKTNSRQKQTQEHEQLCQWGHGCKGYPCQRNTTFVCIML